MEKITINRHNNKEAYKAFTSGKLAVAFYKNNRFGIIEYDNPARTGVNGEYKWSECAFGNMLINLFSGVIDEIYIINPLSKNIFNAYEEIINAIKKNATHIIVKEEKL